jgi:hypothetical protein
MSDQEVAAMEAALTTLMTHLDHLQQDPSNIPLVEETVVWARKCAMDEQVESGLEMLVRLKGCRQGQFEATTRTEVLADFAAEIWLEVLGNIEKKISGMSPEDEERVQAVLSLLRLAIQDYLC